MKFANEPVICVVGLGYVGLPLAVLFGNTDLKVYGYTRSPQRIEELKKCIDRTNELTTEQLRTANIEYSCDPLIISKANFIIVAVPTPVDKANVPDLSPVESASELVGKHISKNSVVVFESTVYPGVTEEICVPIIEKYSNLKCGKDWSVGYSPERTNPGDKDRTPDKIVKVTSGMDEVSGKYIDSVYKRIISAGTFLAKNIKTAEAAKVIENTQRDINIAIINELSMIFDRLEISTTDVLDAAATKWNFIRYKPGLVGGHCIGVDPYYLVYKAEIEGFNPQLISAARRINDGMPEYCVTQIIKMLIKGGKTIRGSKVLILGATFKPDVKDNRNSKVADMIEELHEYGIEVLLHDPILEYAELGEEFSVDREHFYSNISELKNIDGIVYAVDHHAFKAITPDVLQSISSSHPILFDVPGRYHNSDHSGFVYKSL